jgi:hypothetical protein
VIGALFLAACGGTTGPLSATGSWVEQVPPAQGGAQMSLSQSGTSIAGTGVQHREAGADLAFTVSATSMPGPGFTLTYADNTSRTYTFAQPDPNHFTLQASAATRTFARQ